MPLYPGRSKWVAVLMALFLGWFGAHKFYLGRTRTGVLYLLFFWSGVPLFLSLIDALILALKPLYDFGATQQGLQQRTTTAPEPLAVGQVTESWRQDYSAYKETRPWFKSPLVWVPVVLGILVIPNIVQSIVQSPTTTSSPASSATPTIKPRTTQNNSASSTSNEDKACMAMKNADAAVATLARKVLDGNAVSSDANLITSPLNAVNGAYKSLDGDFYWYLVAQGNSMDLLQRSVRSEDWYTAGVAIGAYLDADEYTRFCR